MNRHPSLRTRLGSVPEYIAPMVEEDAAFQAAFEEDSVRLAEALDALCQEFLRFMQQVAVAQAKTAG